MCENKKKSFSWISVKNCGRIILKISKNPKMSLLKKLKNFRFREHVHINIKILIISLWVLTNHMHILIIRNMFACLVYSTSDVEHLPVPGSFIIDIPSIISNAISHIYYKMILRDINWFSWIYLANFKSFTRMAWLLVFTGAPATMRYASPMVSTY